MNVTVPILKAEDMNSLEAHLRRAVANAVVVTDPGPHAVIPGLLPPDIYVRLLDTIPPPDTFDVADKVKSNFDPEKTMTAPALSRESWSWFHDDVVNKQLAPLLTEAFRSHLGDAYEGLFGPDLRDAALNIPHFAFQGRLMLRRPGYRLKPHRDKKSAILTGLVYLARPGDSAEYGTELFRVLDDRPADIKKTYYPEDHGARTELARSVPFVGNSALVFMNIPGMAHGASIPRDAPQSERYAYQFYVGPSKRDLRQLIRRLPPDHAAGWNSEAPDDDY